MELGLKARAFIYYLQNTEKGKSTCKFRIDFLNDAEKDEYTKKAYEKIKARNLEFEKDLVDWDDAEDVAEYEELLKTYTIPKSQMWMVKSEAEIMLDRDAHEAIDWLIQNGYLFRNDYSKHNGGMTVHYTGVTEKGWKVAPMYLKLVKEN